MSKRNKNYNVNSIMELEEVQIIEVSEDKLSSSIILKTPKPDESKMTTL